MSTFTEHKCPDCGKSLQAHELKTHVKECSKRKLNSISLEMLERLIKDGPEAFEKASIVWECPVCGNSTEIKTVIEYTRRPVKICDECLDGLRKLLLKRN